MSDPKQSKEQSHFHVAVILATLGIGSFFVKYGFNIFVSHHLSKALYGDFSIALKTLSMAASMLLFGTGAASKRFLAKYIRTPNAGAVKAYLNWNFKLIIVTSLALLLITSILAAIAFFTHIFLLDPQLEHYHLAFYMLYLAPICAITLLFANYFQCSKNIYISNFLMGSARFIFITVMILGFLYFFDRSLGHRWLWVTTFAALLALCFLEGILLYLRAPTILTEPLTQAVKVDFTTKGDERWTKTSAKLMINQIIFLFLTAMDLYLIEIFDPNEPDVGRYAAMLVLTGIIWTVPTSVFQFVSPKISHLLAEKQYKKLQHAANHANTICFTLTTIAFIGLLFFAKDLLNTFGPNYYTHQVKIAFIIMTSGFYFATFGRLGILLVCYSDNLNTMVNISILEFVLILVFGTLLTYYFGIIGMATASTIAVSAKTLAFIISAKFKTPVKPLSIL